MIAILYGATPDARAQQIDRFFSQGVDAYGTTPGITVLSRVRPDYEPPGIRAGGFVINTNLAQGLGYDSNAIGQPQAKPSMVLQTEASVSARSDWGRNSLKFNAGMNSRQYLAQSQQSTVDWNAAIGGTYDIGRHQAGLDFSHIKSAQTPRDLSNPLLTTPVPYTVDSVQSSFTANFGRFAVVPSLDFGMWRFDDASQSRTPLTLSYQNRNVLTTNLVVRYQASSQRSLLVILRGVQTRYVATLTGQPSRDSQGVDVLAGIEYGAGGVWRYRALAGYQTRQYASSNIRPLSGPTVEANIIWQPTGLTSVTGSALHTIADASLTDNVSYTLSQVRLTIDHELRRNILLQARVEADSAVYPQNAGSATLYIAGTSATWLVNRRVRVVASYEYTHRQSGASSYSENVTMLRVGFGL
jgi:hypothetical protein